jgi:hypothetical protein
MRVPDDTIQLKEMSYTEWNEFTKAESDWEDMRTRNIAFNIVIYDEFIKELAAVCQEHSILTQE